MRTLRQGCLLLLLGLPFFSCSSSPGGPPGPFSPLTTSPSSEIITGPPKVQDLYRIVTDDPASLIEHERKMGWLIWPADQIEEPWRHDLETRCKKMAPERAARLHLLGVAIRWDELVPACYGDEEPSVEYARQLCAQVGRNLWDLDGPGRLVICGPRRTT